MRKLEEKHGPALAVVGVHTPKFPAERETFNVRYAARRHRLEHPVVNDPDFQIWQTYGVRAWPTMVFVDPLGHVIGFHAGEAPFEGLDRAVTRILDEHRATGVVTDAPLDVLEHPPDSDTGLAFPGKVLASDDALYVADSGHHRIVETDHAGMVRRVFGSSEDGHRDGSSSEAQFTYPQGLALGDGDLYVADTENHQIRRVDRGSGEVSTVAGTGARGHPAPGPHPALEAELASPWDLAWHDGRLFIAMAGMHQIWVLDPANSMVGPYAGSGIENLQDGPLDNAQLAQPSGLAVHGDRLLVADSETSAIRTLPLDGRGDATTIAGVGLFDFGDVDGQGTSVRLQHPLGVAAGAEGVFIADTYNNKIKVVDPDQRLITTLAGDTAHGDADGGLAEARFHEPSGVSLVDGVLFVADTNNHAVRRIDLVDERVTTLEITGL